LIIPGRMSRSFQANIPQAKFANLGYCPERETWLVTREMQSFVSMLEAGMAQGQFSVQGNIGI